MYVVQESMIAMAGSTRITEGTHIGQVAGRGFQVLCLV
jgi:hypothetical protein